MNKRTYKEALDWASSCIQEQNIDPTAPEFILQANRGWTKSQLILHLRETISEPEWTEFQAQIARLRQFEPAQYIVGRAPFYGRDFSVNSDVLIPESETEELVEWVLNSHSEQSLRVLDLGTGSGVIGITLKLERPNWQVTLSDVSVAALTVAQNNATALDADVRLVHSDLFTGLTLERFDLIVTNPPYIDRDDTGRMDEAVLKFEPAIALFADHHGLAFYQQLFTDGQDFLTAGGEIFAETGDRQESALVSLAQQQFGPNRIETRHDIAGRMRMVCITNQPRG